MSELLTKEHNIMINLSTLLTPELTIYHPDRSSSKKQVLETISDMASAADHRIKYSSVLAALQARERLGSTVIGHGIAIPHARIKNLTHVICILLTLPEAILFDSDDAEAVDIIFGLLVPEQATEIHLEIFSALTEKLRSTSYRKKLRAATSSQKLYHAAIEKHKSIKKT